MSELSAKQSDTHLRSSFFRSVTIVTSASAIILAGSEGILFPAALTPLFAIAAWIVVEHFRWLRIPVLVGNLFGIAAFAVAASEFVGGTLERKLLAGSHLVVYLSWIVLLLPKGHRQYWWLIALCVLQLAIAGLLSGGVGFGAALLGMMLLLLWTMSVFSLFRVQDQHVERRTIAESDAPIPAAGIRSFQQMEHSGRATPELENRLDRIKTFLNSFLGLNGLFGKVQAKPSFAKSRSEGSLILIRNGLQRDASETWVGWRFRWMVAGSYLVSLILALIVFAAFPRVWVPGSTLFGDTARGEAGVGNMTGFSETVQLGDVGQIMQSNERVLVFDIENLATMKPASAEAFAEAMNVDEIRFRGNVLGYYSEGSWSKGFREKGFGRGEDIRRFGEFVKMDSDFRINIVQDPCAVTYAFAPYPVSKVRDGSIYRIAQNEVSGSLIWVGQIPSASASRPFTVELPRLDRKPESTFEYWTDPEDIPEAQAQLYRDRRTQFANGMYIMDGFLGPIYRYGQFQMALQPRNYNASGDLKVVLPRLYELANQICRDNGQLVEPSERVDRIVRYLSNDNGFGYSLTPSRKDRSLDPVEDFLLNTKSGHCEYFASACTLMMQAAEVPARLVNGYYGSELNSLTGKNEVRQRHAHAWSEAFIDDHWRTVEATPSADRRQDLATKDPTTLINNLQAAITDLWNDGIYQMSAERQKQFFAPLITTSQSLIETIRQRGLFTTIRAFAVEFINSPTSWISWKGGLVTFVMLLFVALLARLNLFDRLMALVRYIIGYRGKAQRTTRSVIRFYEGFCSLCERHGLILPAANSALENAVLATEEFSVHLDSPELQSLPSRIATAFNEVRFGHLTMTDEQASRIGRDLSAFADALKKQSQPASA